MSVKETAVRQHGGGPEETRARTILGYQYTPTSPALSSLLDQAIERAEFAQTQADAWREIAWKHRRIKSELELLAALAAVLPDSVRFCLFRPEVRP